MRYNSELTSVRQIPALFKHVPWKPDTINLDWGCGKYYDGVKYLYQYKQVASLMHDPYNRPGSVIALYKNDYDTVTISNVLNVIASDGARVKCIVDAFSHLKTHGKMYISVWIGNSDGKPTVSKQNTWQANRPLESYTREIRKALPKGGYDLTIVKNKGFKYIEITKRA